MIPKHRSPLLSSVFAHLSKAAVFLLQSDFRLLPVEAKVKFYFFCVNRCRENSV
jgi:hypothetical protein